MRYLPWPAAALAMLLPSALGAQTDAGDALESAATIRRVNALVDLTPDDGSALVRLEVELTPGDGDIGLKLLGFGGAVVDEVQVGEADALRIALAPSGGSLVTGTVPAAELARVFTGDLIVFHYTVRGATVIDDGAARVHVPVLTVDAPLATDASDVFRSHVLVPMTWSVREGFPTTIRAAAEGAYEVALAVPPAVISIRARTDGRWLPGAPLLLDALAGVLLLGFAIVGWRHLRMVAA